MTDVYGDIVDVGTVETAMLSTLQAWMPGHLAHQERRLSMGAGALLQPRSWPTLSELNLKRTDLLPAIIVVSPGEGPATHDRGAYRGTWTFEVVVVVGARLERDARRLSGIYIAAVRGALVQNRTLGGRVELCRWIGAGRHTAGRVSGADLPERAVFSTFFEVIVRDVANSRQGPDTPPADPHNPDPLPPIPDTADITVTSEAL